MGTVDKSVALTYDVRSSTLGVANPKTLSGNTRYQIQCKFWRPPKLQAQSLKQAALLPIAIMAAVGFNQNTAGPLQLTSRIWKRIPAISP